MLPNYQEFMNPALEIFYKNSNAELGTKDIKNDVADMLNLSDEERLEMIPSNTQSILNNRLQWAIYHMYRAGLLTKSKKGSYKITKEGIKAIEHKEKINDKFLNNFESYRQFINKKNNNKKIIEKYNYENDPFSRIEGAFEEINEKLEYDLLDKLKTVDYIFFEKIALDLMSAMGYGGKFENSIQMTPKSHDGGIDGIIVEDVLGLNKIYIQTKRYNTNKVCSKEMQNFIGALASNGVTKGVFITLCEFESKAAQMADKQNIVLINGKKLAELMIKYDVGIKIESKKIIKKIDISYFEE